MKRINDLFVFKALFILFFCFMIAEISVSQSYNSFVLKGKCSISDGLIHLGTLDGNYYPCIVDGYDVKLINGYFSIDAPIKYPYAFRILIKQNGVLVYVSDMFFVEKGLQTININVGENKGLLTIDNTSMEELKSDYALWFKSYNSEVNEFNIKKDSLLHIYNNSLPSKETSRLMNEMDKLSAHNDTLLLQYTKKHPGSFVALWKLVDKVTNGYKVIFDSILTCFSPEIKATYTAKALMETLKTARIGRVGNHFPALYLSDTKTKILLQTIQTNSKYTLIDFWFSSCAPCKSQFQELRRLYDSYSFKGFNIIGISVDQEEDIDKWRSAINSYGLIWPQYLDLNQTESRKLSILSYPSNFLLDEKGIIIAKNISLYDLSKILEDNLR